MSTITDEEYDDIKRFARRFGISIHDVCTLIDRERETEFWEVADQLKYGGDES